MSTNTHRITITSQMHNGTSLLALKGEFDRSNMAELMSTVDEWLESCSSIVLDFQGVTFIDGGVLSLLSRTLEQLEGRGWLAVVRPAPWARRLFDIVGVSARRNFRLFSTMEKALGAIDRA